MSENWNKLEEAGFEPAAVFERLSGQGGQVRRGTEVFAPSEPCLTMRENAAQQLAYNADLVAQVRESLRRHFGSPEEFLAS